jgi:hypothetical protein
MCVQEAIALHKELIALDPESADLQGSLGTCYKVRSSALVRLRAGAHTHTYSLLSSCTHTGSWHGRGGRACVHSGPRALRGSR